MFEYLTKHLIMNDNNEFSILNMQISVHTFLSVFNWIFGIIPLIIAIERNDIEASILIFLAMLASTGMHLSDNKGGRKPLLCGNYSKLLLNIDRVVAWFSFLWIIYRVFVIRQFMTGLQMYLLVFGMSCNGLSELITNSFWHSLIHGTWHLCAYFGFYTVIN